MIISWSRREIQTPRLARVIVLVLVILPLAVQGLAFQGGMFSEENVPKIIPASDILAKIQNEEPIEYDNILIEDDLDLRQFSLRSNITSPIKIIDSTFKGDVIFNGVHFDEKVDFSGSNFTKAADFYDAIFGDDVDFRTTKFNNGVHFNGDTFCGNSDFADATFCGHAYFSETIFNKDAYFYRATFEKRTNELSREAYFTGAAFRGRAIFSRSTFREYARFDKATFSKDAYFNEAVFSNNADFSEATFREHKSKLEIVLNRTNLNRTNSVRYRLNTDVDFRGTTFNRESDFSETVFNGNIDCSDATFDGYSDFSGASLSGYVYLKGATFRDYLIGWNNIKNALLCDEATYLRIIKNFKDHGQFDEADDCQYLYRLEYMDGPYDVLAWITCGFGVKWLQTIYFSISLLIIYGWVYFLTIVRNDPKEMIDNPKEIIATQLFDSLWFSAMVLLSIPSELYPKKIDVYREYTKHMKYHLPILERLMGWGILILFINTLSRSMLHL